MIPPESSGASRTKVARCNLGVRAVEVARTAGCWSVVHRFARPRRGARPSRRLVPLPPRPASPPTGHDSPPAPPRAVTSRRPDPAQPTVCDHSTPHARHVLTTRGPPGAARTAARGPAARQFTRPRRRTRACRATSTRPHTPRTLRTPAGRPVPAPPIPPTPADRSRLAARPTPRGHIPSAGPRPADGLRPLDAPRAARPDHARTPGAVRTAARRPAARQFVRPRRRTRGVSCDRTRARRLAPATSRATSG